eukprot:13169637-Heterocapsa_arctica.AAC.1
MDDELFRIAVRLRVHAPVCVAACRIKAAGQSRATYRAATDPFTQAEIKSLRTNFFEALWPKKYMC